MKHVRIMVVDDDGFMREYLERVLKREGFNFTMAPGSDEALTMLKEQRHHVLLTDFMMPCMNGIELAHEAKAVDPLIDCVLMTAEGAQDIAVDAMREGFSDYIEKPIADIPVLVLTLTQACKRAELRQEREELLHALERHNHRLESNLKELGAAYRRLQLQDDALTADLRGAQRMQIGLLPKFLPRVEKLDCFAYYKPCEMLGGDFFDVVALGGNSSAFYVADVSGHGVRAAMVTVIIHECIHLQRTQAAGAGRLSKPAATLELINRTLIEEAFDFPIHVTMTYAVVDAEAGTILVGNAGHVPGLLALPDGGVERLTATGPALGMTGDASYQERLFDMPPGSTMTLYTDGVIEATDALGEEYGIERFEKMLVEHRGQRAEKLCLKVEQALDEHRAGRPNLDDITLMATTRCPDGVWSSDGHASVRISTPERQPAAALPQQTDLEAGWAEEGLVVRAQGRLTWQSSPTLMSLIEEARAAKIGRVWLDLYGCEHMDSTILGLVYQSANLLILTGVNENLRRSLAELGILDSLTLSGEKPPEAVLMPQKKISLASQEQARLMLSTHEALAQISEGNQMKFSGVVSSLKKKTN